MYKKSYVGFAVSLVVFLALVIGVAFLPGMHGDLALRLNTLVTAWYMVGLTLHIWLTEQVYWYNGTTFEEAEAAGSERRKAFAWKHAKVFGMLALCVTAFAVLMHLLGASAWIDFVVGMVGLVVAACRTIPFKL